MQRSGRLSEEFRSRTKRSDAEFLSKLGGALQDADESQLWLEFLREECGVQADLTLPLEGESDEVMAILITMIRNTGT